MCTVLRLHRERPEALGGDGRADTRTPVQTSVPRDTVAFRFLSVGRYNIHSLETPSPVMVQLCPAFRVLASDILIREMAKVGMTSKAAPNTIRNEKTFSDKVAQRNKRKRPMLRPDGRANKHLDGTAAGDELQRAREKILQERGR